MTNLPHLTTFRLSIKFKFLIPQTTSLVIQMKFEFICHIQYKNIILIVTMAEFNYRFRRNHPSASFLFLFNLNVTKMKSFKISRILKIKIHIVEGLIAH